MGEGLVAENPAKQTPKVRARPTERYRLNVTEMLAMLEGVETLLEWRCIGLGVLGGFRIRELRGLQGKHFRRDGFIEVTAETGKGSKARWVAVAPGLRDVVAEVLQNVGFEEYVLPAQRWRNPPRNTERESLSNRPVSPQAITSMVVRVAERANVAGRVTSHCLRMANAKVMAKYVGVYAAKAELGHADMRTTQLYAGEADLDQVAEAIQGVPIRTSVRSAPLNPSKATTGVEPVWTALQAAA